MSANKEYKEYLEFNGLKIDPVIFTQGFVPGCELSICGGRCCHWGVYVDVKFVPVILEHKEKIKAVMDKHQPKDESTWFEEEPEEDNDFPSGYALGTEVFDDASGRSRCVFNDSIGRCSLQVMAVENGIHKWAIKPEYCIMYPLAIIDSVLTCDLDHAERLDYCGTKHPENYTQTVFEAMTEELIHIVGNDGYIFLKEHYELNYKGKVNFTKVNKEKV